MAELSNFAKRLHQLRKSKHMTLRVMADFCELSKSTLWRYENGEAEPSTDDIIRLAEFFEVTTDYLLGKS